MAIAIIFCCILIVKKKLDYVIESKDVDINSDENTGK